MVIGLLLDGNQLALWDHFNNGHIRTLVEELGGREVQHPIVLDYNKKAILGPADGIRVGKLQRWGKRLHLVGHTIAVSISYRPDRCFARSNEQHIG